MVDVSRYTVAAKTWPPATVNWALLNDLRFSISLIDKNIGQESQSHATSISPCLRSPIQLVVC
jgi:hypothetical protein